MGVPVHGFGTQCVNTIGSVRLESAGGVAPPIQRTSFLVLFTALVPMLCGQSEQEGVAPASSNLFSVR